MGRRARSNRRQPSFFPGDVAALSSAPSLHSYLSRFRRSIGPGTITEYQPTRGRDMGETTLFGGAGPANRADTAAGSNGVSCGTAVARGAGEIGSCLVALHRDRMFYHKPSTVTRSGYEGSGDAGSRLDDGWTRAPPPQMLRRKSPQHDIGLDDAGDYGLVW